MTRSPLIFALTVVLLGACSPAAYQVNSPASQQKVPESEPEGYMRILGDLRWDQLRTKEEWMRRFPGCLEVSEYQLDAKDASRGKPSCEFKLGGLLFYLEGVWLAGYPAGSSDTRTDQVLFSIPSEAQSRAFLASIDQKYSVDSSDGDLICSRFSCFVRSWLVMIKPTPYATSILDAVKVDPSEF